MLFEKVFFAFSLIHLVNLHLQINLHLTDWINENDNIRHDCLQVSAYVGDEPDPRQMISYCMGEFPSKFQIKVNHREQKLTFAELFQRKITTEQLYLWSAPIDRIEQYQFYLNQLSNSEKTSLASQSFYNCTLPNFGPQCQYVLQGQKPSHLSLDEIIHDYYRYNRYQPTLLTCYVHLECHRGPFPSCLDWTEICDGKEDCLNGESDEEHCWQLEIPQEDKNEYPHSNRQCVSEAFLRDDSGIHDCNGKLVANEVGDSISRKEDSVVAEPSFKYEDVSCVKRNIIKESPYILTSSCVPERTRILSQAMFSIKPSSISAECWTALKYLTPLSTETRTFFTVVFERGVLNEMIKKVCPDIIYIPAVPVLLGHIFMAYNKSTVISGFGPYLTAPTYFCYNEQRLQIPDDNRKKLLPDNSTCHFYDIKMPPSVARDSSWIHRYVARLYVWLLRNTILIHQNSELLNKSMMYRCINSSEYISRNRLFDGVGDCYREDDERMLNKTCPEERDPNYFHCKTVNECIPAHLVQDKTCDCTKYKELPCDDEYSDSSHSQYTISFQTTCDGYAQLAPQTLENQNETDETNCEQWPEIHIYNRCDGFWHTPDGSDELNCPLSSLLNCPRNYHICVSLKTNELMCLPKEKVNDGNVDCLGAADEPALCQSTLYQYSPQTFYCYQNGDDLCIEAQGICDGYRSCYDNKDEEACTTADLSGVSDLRGVCTGNYESDRSYTAIVLCRRFSYIFMKLRVYFTLDQNRNFIKQNTRQESSLPYQSAKQDVQWYQPRCHRGLDLQIWLDKEKNLTTNVCLCPPSYYGDTCQYQNQRVSLTLQFRATSDSVRTPFMIIVSLTDDTDERSIHSYEQFTYLPISNCQRKFNVYLLYSTRPKDETKGYSVHIDIYEKKTLDYRTSAIKALKFAFLPVHRLALYIDIPRIRDDIDDCSDSRCRNGKCRKYFDDQVNRTFCQCKKGWSGRFCTIPYMSTCSSDSVSLGILANNRSLCLCPASKMGPRCLITNVICQNSTCLNHGECVPADEYGTSAAKFICVCPKEFAGDRCEIARTKLLMVFDQSIRLPSSIRIHFIEVKFQATPVRTTTFKTTSSGQNSAIVYWSLPFHIAFVELANLTYYLVHVQTIYNQSSVIDKALHSSDRCSSINELFNETVANSAPLRRIKYYHLPCQRNAPRLKCFYDEVHLCLCQQIEQQSVANCFEFDHQMNVNCSGGNSCQNGGRCFQEQTTCPRISVCQCPSCYYGSRCQFSTSGFDLSLDAILGYHIQPNLAISRQPVAVSISLILTLVIALLGFTNSILSIITFHNQSIRETGCGRYLLSSSVTSLLITIVFLLKFFILLFSQMGSITNRSFLTSHCRSIDFLLRFGLTMDQWLTALIAIDRAVVVIKGINFDKKKSKSVAKWVIIGLVLVSIVTNIHDPIYRSLFTEDNNDDDDERRIWCVVEYPSAFRTINSIVNIFHLVTPFVINLISALIIIIKGTRRQAVMKKKTGQKEIFNEQIQQHKSLLIGPCVLIVLDIPRLIISFTSGCITSVSSSWLFLLGYFMSLVPPLLTFILFVLPSATYKQAFRKAITQYRNIMGRSS